MPADIFWLICWSLGGLIVMSLVPSKRVDRILYKRRGNSDEIKVGNNDYVIVTLGSMTEASSLGSMDSAPDLNGKTDEGRGGFAATRQHGADLQYIALTGGKIHPDRIKLHDRSEHCRR